jgi:hypothetical protein
VVVPTVKATILSGVLAFVVLTGCSARMVSGSASPALPAVPASSGVAVDADRKVCVDLDARGGTLYNTFVVPMMSGASGRKSMDVDLQQMIHAVSAVTRVGEGELDAASPGIADEGGRLVAAAEAFRAHDHVDTTALLTAFVGLSVECTKSGHKPSWFDQRKLTNS